MISMAPPAALVTVVVALGLALGNVVSQGSAGLRAAGRVLAVAGGALAVAVVLLAPWSFAVLGGPDRWQTLAGVPVPSSTGAGWGALLRLAAGPIGDAALGWAFLAAAALPLLIGARSRLAWAGRAWSIALVAWAVGLVGRAGCTRPPGDGPPGPARAGRGGDRPRRRPRGGRLPARSPRLPVRLAPGGGRDGRRRRRRGHAARAGGQHGRAMGPGPLGLRRGHDLDGRQQDVGRLPGVVARRPPCAAGQRVGARTRSRLRRERGRAPRPHRGVAGLVAGKCRRHRRRRTTRPQPRHGPPGSTVGALRRAVRGGGGHAGAVDPGAPEPALVSGPGRPHRGAGGPARPAPGHLPRWLRRLRGRRRPPPEGGAERAGGAVHTGLVRHRGVAGADGMATRRFPAHRAPPASRAGSRRGPSWTPWPPPRPGSSRAPTAPSTTPRPHSATRPPSGWTGRGRSPSPSWGRGPMGSRSSWRPPPGWPWRLRSPAGAGGSTGGGAP